MIPKIKVCGITNLEDGKFAASAGASIIGVVLSDRSPRKGSPELVVELSRSGMSVAGVYTDMISAKRDATEEEFIQLHFPHGRKEIEHVHEQLGKRTISVVFPEKNAAFLSEAKEKLAEGTDLVLADFGRSITPEDQETIHDLEGYRIGLAGKIYSDNLQIVLKSNPYFIDLSSRLESYPGKKDHERLGEFMEAFRHEASAL